MSEYVKLSDLKLGDVVYADDGFDCIKPNVPLTVRANDGGELYVACGDHGEHYLDGQLEFNEDDDDTIVGLRKTL